ncbi:hypothetical protein ACIBI9_30360 [Nonomuraea sp. NPDC050451]|uniref:hypothetical protein n=1 Tax=Nonomuraea sp. NPDC050451 TaxID=3364364 RepID=UPI003792C4F2
MSDAPAVRILPDGADYLLKRRAFADGRQMAKVSWIDITPGPRGKLVPREEWLPMDRVGLPQGVGYSAVDHEYIAQNPDDEVAGPAHTGQSAAAARPAGWPAQVPLPGEDPGLARQATAWLLDRLPPDYRAHQVVHDPYVPTWMAAGHVDSALAALRNGYRGAAVDLKARLQPETIAAVLEVYRTEGRRLTATAAAIKLVGRVILLQRLSVSLDSTRGLIGAGMSVRSSSVLRPDNSHNVFM